MGYLNIHNVGISGNTFRLYLTDYGKTLLTTGNGLVSAISKFGLSDSDIDYRAFAVSGSTSGNCASEGSLSALTSSCFYDIPGSRGRKQNDTTINYGTLSAVMLGPSCKVKDNRVITYDLDIGTTAVNSTLWSNYNPSEIVNGINEPATGMFSNCWTVGASVINFFPTYCTACADFNGDGVVDKEDFKLLINLLGAKANKGEELIGDFNGDGKVDTTDLGYFNKCLVSNGAAFNNYCLDNDIFCMLCDKLGDKTPCAGDCTKCI